MARCGCSSECACTVRGSSCVRVTGSGSSTAPYVASVILDPDADNVLECGDDGLKAVLPDPTVYSEETDCITLEGDGSALDPLHASPVLDPDDLNGLSCGVDGMFVPSAGYRRIQGVVLVDQEALPGDFLAIETSGGDVTITLPAASSCPGEIVTVKKIVAANDVIIDGDGTDTIDGSGSLTLSAQWSSATVVSWTFGWYLIGST